MDARHLDDLAREIGAKWPRRGVLGALGSVAVLVAAPTLDADARKKKKKKNQEEVQGQQEEVRQEVHTRGPVLHHGGLWQQGPVCQRGLRVPLRAEVLQRHVYRARVLLPEQRVWRGAGLRQRKLWLHGWFRQVRFRVHRSRL